MDDKMGGLSMRDLSVLKQQVLEYCERKKNNGGIVVNYNCPDCSQILMTVTPNEKGDTWDSAVQCYECGETHFVVKSIGHVSAASLKEVTS